MADRVAGGWSVCVEDWRIGVVWGRIRDLSFEELVRWESRSLQLGSRSVSRVRCGVSSCTGVDMFMCHMHAFLWIDGGC